LIFKQQIGYTAAAAAAAAAARACVERHLSTRNEMRVSGSDSYALLFLFYKSLVK